MAKFGLLGLALLVAVLVAVFAFVAVVDALGRILGALKAQHETRPIARAERRAARKLEAQKKAEQTKLRKDEADRRSEVERLSQFREENPVQITGVPNLELLSTINKLLDQYIAKANSYRPQFAGPTDTRFRSTVFSYPFEEYFPRINAHGEGPDPSNWEIFVDSLAIRRGREMKHIYSGLASASQFPVRRPEVNFDREPPPELPSLPRDLAPAEIASNVVVVSAADGTHVDLRSPFLCRAYASEIAQADALKASAKRLRQQVLTKVDEAIEAKELMEIHTAKEELRYRETREAIAAEFESKKREFEQKAREELVPLRSVYEGLLSGTQKGIEEHFELALRSLALPLPRDYPWQVYYRSDERLLQVNQRVPPIGEIIVKRRDSNRAPAKRDTEHVLRRYYPSVSLNIASHAAINDINNDFDSIAVNCWLRFFDKSTGKLKNAFVSSLAVPKKDILDIDVGKADPLEAFRALRGVFVYSTEEIVPIEPSIRLDKNDTRFVEGKEVLEGMAQGQNLATMDWQEFEHLIRELLAKEYGKDGTEVRITRASRDRGVDAIVFDPDPLRGGKYVVQAKRYNNLVDVSAVRDLYGTMLNEGAARGILVTTSRYGRDAHEFASNKPITLLNGQHLLSLLAKHGYKFKIDLS